jgi:Ni,Fe-hydrogenase I cytochrome b subunit
MMSESPHVFRIGILLFINKGFGTTLESMIIIKLGVFLLRTFYKRPWFWTPLESRCSRNAQSQVSVARFLATRNREENIVVDPISDVSPSTMEIHIYT